MRSPRATLGSQQCQTIVGASSDQPHRPFNVLVTIGAIDTTSRNCSMLNDATSSPTGACERPAAQTTRHDPAPFAT